METLSYGELLRAGWTLLWRIVTAIFGLVFLIDTLLIWTMPELVRSAPSLWASRSAAHAGRSADTLCRHAVGPPSISQEAVSEVSLLGCPQLLLSLPLQDGGVLR